MVKLTRQGRWECSYCGKEWDTEISAIACQKSHEIIFVQMKITDLAALQKFIFTKDEKFLTETLLDTIRKYARKFGK